MSATWQCLATHDTDTMNGSPHLYLCIGWPHLRPPKSVNLDVPYLAAAPGLQAAFSAFLRNIHPGLWAAICPQGSHNAGTWLMRTWMIARMNLSDLSSTPAHASSEKEEYQEHCTACCADFRELRWTMSTAVYISAAWPSCGTVETCLVASLHRLDVAQPYFKSLE